MLLAVVPEDTSNKEITGITSQHARHRTIVKVRVGSLGFVHPYLGPFGHQVHAECAVRGHLVELLEFGHVEMVVVASHVEIIASKRRVGFDEVMCANNALWVT